MIRILKWKVTVKLCKEIGEPREKLSRSLALTLKSYDSAIAGILTRVRSQSKCSTIPATNVSVVWFTLIRFKLIQRFVIILQ